MGMLIAESIEELSEAFLGFRRSCLSVFERLKGVSHRRSWFQVEGVDVARDVEVEVVVLDLLARNHTSMLNQLEGIGVELNQFLADPAQFAPVFLRPAFVLR